jgi:hypothetical protein
MRGGYRAGAGRPRGSKSSTRSLTKPIPTNIILVAAGQPPLRAADALGLLQAAYTNESLPEPVRLQAAAYALPYETPKAVTVDGRSVEQIREEVRQEFLHGHEDVGERLLEQINRRREIIRQQKEAALRKQFDADTWCPPPSPEILPPLKQRAQYGSGAASAETAGVQRNRYASGSAEPPVTDVEPQILPPEPEPAKPLPLSVQYRHLIRRW